MTGKETFFSAGGWVVSSLGLAMPEQAVRASGHNASATAGTVPASSGEKNDEVK